PPGVIRPALGVVDCPSGQSCGCAKMLARADLGSVHGGAPGRQPPAPAPSGVPGCVRKNRNIRENRVQLISIADSESVFDREAGATCGGWTRFRKPGAYNHTAQHAVECAE